MLAGLPGRGYTSCWATSGRRRHARGREAVFLSWDKLAARGKFSREEAEGCKSNLSTVDLGDYPDVDLVVEAIIEDREAKVGVFKDLEAGGVGGIFASNTSSIPISSMQRELDDPSRLVGLHFFNPVHAMKLVEVVEGRQSSRETCLWLKDWFDGRGKKSRPLYGQSGFYRQ